MRIATGRTGPRNDKNGVFSAVGGGVPDAPQLICGIPRNDSCLCSSWVLAAQNCSVSQKTQNCSVFKKSS